MRRHEWDLARVRQSANSSREVCTHQETPPAKTTWLSLAGVCKGGCPRGHSAWQPPGFQPGLNLAAQKAIKGQPRAATGDACLATYTESKLWGAACFKNPTSARMARTHTSNHKSKIRDATLPGTLTVWGTDASVTWYGCSCICEWGTECISHEFWTFLPSTLISYSQ